MAPPAFARARSSKNRPRLTNSSTAALTSKNIASLRSASHHPGAEDERGRRAQRHQHVHVRGERPQRRPRGLVEPPPEQRLHDRRPAEQQPPRGRVAAEQGQVGDIHRHAQDDHRHRDHPTHRQHREPRPRGFLRSVRSSSRARRRRTPPARRPRRGRPPRSHRPSETRAVAEAKFTLASSTPSTRFSARSTRRTQDAHVIPPIRRVTARSGLVMKWLAARPRTLPRRWRRRPPPGRRPRP